MRTSRNTVDSVESRILHSLMRKTKVTGYLLEDKTASIDPKCKLYMRPQGSLQFITALLLGDNHVEDLNHVKLLYSFVVLL